VRRALAILVAAAVVAGAAGCGAGEPEGSPDPFFDALIDRAQAGGADEEQLSVLVEAAAAGGVWYEDAAAQVDRFFACLEPLGYAGERLPDREITQEYRVPEYAVQVPDDDSDAVYEECLRRTADFVLEARATQPLAMEAKDAARAALRPELEECMVENGRTVDPEWTWDELFEAMLAAYGEDEEVLCIRMTWNVS